MSDRLYVAYGLVVAVPFACEELAPADAASIPEVSIEEGAVPISLPDAQLHDPDLDVSLGMYLLRSSHARARFLVQGGRRITFERLHGASEDVLRHVLLHQVMAALLRQRGMLVLHASGAISPRGVVVVGGESGAGKSTTIAALTKLGWPLQSDDVSALRLDENGAVEVVAGARKLHLFGSASKALSMDTHGVTPNAWHRMKLALPALVEPLRAARLLRRIVHLERGPVTQVRVETVIGRAKLPLLLRSLYGPYLAEELAAERALVATAMQRIEMLRIVRPLDGWTMDDVMAAIVAE